MTAVTAHRRERGLIVVALVEGTREVVMVAIDDVVAMNS